MNFIGQLHGAEVEIRPLDEALARGVELGVAVAAEDQPGLRDFFYLAVLCNVCIVRTTGVPTLDGSRTTEWDSVSAWSADLMFMGDVAQVALLLGMGYRQNAT